MHMNRRIRLVFSAAVVGVMIGLVLIFGYRGQHEMDAATRQRWLPDLATHLAQVDRLRLRSASGGVVTLLHGDGGWVVEERAGFAADFPKLQALLDALATARLLEAKTTQPEYFPRLGLTDIERPDSGAVQVEIWAGRETPLVNVLLGNDAGARGGRYVRAATERQTWLIDTTPTAHADPADWIEHRSSGVEFAEVALVERELDDRLEFRAVRSTADGDASLVAQSLPAGKAPRYISVFDAAARAILTMEPEDVRKSAELDFSKAALTRIVCFDGLVIEARALKTSDGNWMAMSAHVDESRQHAPATDEAPAPAQPALSPEERAARLEARFAGWAFKVSDYVQGEASKRLADYIQDDKTHAEASRSEQGKQ